MNILFIVNVRLVDTDAIQELNRQFVPKQRQVMNHVLALDTYFLVGDQVMDDDFGEVFAVREAIVAHGIDGIELRLDEFNQAVIGTIRQRIFFGAAVGAPDPRVGDLRDIGQLHTFSAQDLHLFVGSGDDEIIGFGGDVVDSLDGQGVIGEFAFRLQNAALWGHPTHRENRENKGDDDFHWNRWCRVGKAKALLVQRVGLFPTAHCQQIGMVKGSRSTRLTASGLASRRSRRFGDECQTPDGGLALNF